LSIINERLYVYHDISIGHWAGWHKRSGQAESS
jgi:hypothetical protein